MEFHYLVLGSHRSAAAAELRAAWRAAARSLHPDRHPGVGPEDRARTAEAFAAASLAWSVLSDPAKRAEYHAALDLLTAECRACGGGGVTWRQEGFATRTASVCQACEGSGRIERGT